METTQIWIENLKCGGCANTIKKNVKEFSGVTSVIVSPEEEVITIAHQVPLDLKAIKARLKQLGYPEKDSVEGFEKLTSNLKSYVSCAVGRLTKEDEEMHTKTS